MQGCQHNNDEEPVILESAASIDVFDFAFIKKAPEATESHDLEEVIKVYFNENDSSQDKGFAIDIEEGHVFINTGMGSRGVRTSIEQPLEVSQIKGVIDILHKHHIQDWQEDYTFENPDSYQDGYGWQLWLQFKDGTVEKHKGSGTNPDKVTPDNFDDFAKELHEFMDEKINDE